VRQGLGTRYRRDEYTIADVVEMHRVQIVDYRASVITMLDISMYRVQHLLVHPVPPTCHVARHAATNLPVLCIHTHHPAIERRMLMSVPRLYISQQQQEHSHPCIVALPMMTRCLALQWTAAHDFLAVGRSECKAALNCRRLLATCLSCLAAACMMRWRTCAHNPGASSELLAAALSHSSPRLDCVAHMHKRMHIQLLLMLPPSAANNHLR
jgi:hypothetical protein